MAGSRADPRTRLATKAFVSIPPLPSKPYEVREVSRGGILLAFEDAVTTLQELEKAQIDVGANADIAFAVVVDNKRQLFSVRARIIRITRQGVAFQFVTRNPPQLAALRELFLQAADEVRAAGSQSDAGNGRPKRRIVPNPSDTSIWQDWKLID